MFASLAAGGPLVAAVGPRAVYAVGATGILLSGLVAAAAFASPARTRRVVARSTARLRFA
jgi:hypothetical protein